PKDVGRSYEAVIRVNSQSGKGGVAYVLKHDYHLDLPRRMQLELSQVVQAVADAQGGEVAPTRIWELFRETYLDRKVPLQVHGYAIDSDAEDRIRASVTLDGVEREVEGVGNGPIAGMVHALSTVGID